MIAGCAEQRGSRDEETVARMMFEALREKDAGKIGACIVTSEDVEYVMTFFSQNTKEYQAMTLEEKHEFELLFQQRVEQVQTEWLDHYEAMIDQIDDILRDNDIEWKKIRYDGYKTAYSDFEIEYMPRYGEFGLLFHQGHHSFRLNTDGIVKIHDQWKLQLGEFTIEAIENGS